MKKEDKSEEIVRTDTTFEKFQSLDGEGEIDPIRQMGKRTFTNMKYEVIIYLVENYNLSIKEIINLTIQDVAEICKNETDARKLSTLKNYIEHNIKLIKLSRYFFPGQHGKGQASEGSILHSLHFYLETHYHGKKNLRSLGLRSKPESFYEKPKEVEKTEEEKAEEPKTAADIFDWASKL